jgi:cytoskeletal protein RodZ
MRQLPMGGVMKLKSLLAVVVLIAAAVVVAYQMRTEPLQRQPARATGLTSENENQKTESENGNRKPENGNLKSETVSETENGKAADPRFQQWIASEARLMDAPRVDSDAKEKEMSAVASKLTRQQSRQLLHTAKNPGSPAAEKILSTYLLVQAGPRAVQELKELIASPVSPSGPVHSAAEMNNMRDKTLRIMALDGLSSRAKSDPEARAALAKAIGEIQDPYVKRQAQDRLDRVQRE